VPSFREKPKMDISVTTGMIVLGARAMSGVVEFAGRGKTDIMTDFIPDVLKRGGKMAAFYNTRRWFDVGTFASMERLDEALAAHPLSFMV